MKKRSCLILAVMLVTLQLIMAVAPVRVSAETASLNRSYNVYPVEFESYSSDARVIEAEWAQIPHSSAFVSSEVGSTARPGTSSFSASFQAAWAPIPDDTENITLYLLLKVKDNTPYVGSNSDLDGVMFSFVIDGVKVYKDFIHVQESGYTPYGGFWGNWKLSNGQKFTVGADETEDGYTLKISFSIKKTSEFAFDFLVQDNYAGPTGSLEGCERFSWNGMTCGISTPMKTESAGACVPEGKFKVLASNDGIDENADVLLFQENTLVASLNKSGSNTVTLPDLETLDNDKMMIGWKDAQGKLYPVGGTIPVGEEQIRFTAVTIASTDYEVLKGAAVLIQEPTALRFEIKENASALSALDTAVQEKGAIIVQTSLLTEEILADGTFSADELTAANVAFDKVVFTTAENDIYDAVKDQIADVGVAYSVVSFLTVRYADDTVKCYTSEYHKEDNSRSVREIAEMAYADRANIRAEVDGTLYKFKVSKEYAVENFTLFSYSPYTEEQLDVLAKLKK